MLTAIGTVYEEGNSQEQNYRLRSHSWDVADWQLLRVFFATALTLMCNTAIMSRP
jgi:hypothetical protein